MKKEYISHSAEETEAIGAMLARELDEGKIRRTFIAMHGEMGVGKTAFVRGFASVFGITGVKSPTYTVVNEYRGRAFVFHFDMYRIESDDDLYSIGFDDYIERDGYCIAEWCENIEDSIPAGAISVTVARGTDAVNDRLITVDVP